MKKFPLLILFAATVFAGADELTPFRARAEQIAYGSKEDYQLGQELCGVFAKLAAKRKPVLPHPLFISQLDRKEAHV